MPQLTGARSWVGEDVDSPNRFFIRRRSSFQSQRHSTICQAFIIRGSANYRNRDAAQGSLGRRGQGVFFAPYAFLS